MLLSSVDYCDAWIVVKRLIEFTDIVVLASVLVLKFELSLTFCELKMRLFSYANVMLPYLRL